MKVTGENAILYEYVSGDWIPYACARTISIEFTTDMLETSVSGSGAWATFLPTKNSWTASMEGVVYLEESGKLSIADLRTKQFNQTKIQIKYERTDGDGNVYAEVGYAYITNSSDTGSFNDMDTFSISFRGTGQPAQVLNPASITGFYKVSTLGYPWTCAIITPIALYSSEPIGIGTIMYVDAGMSIPLTGKTYIVSADGGPVYHMSNLTGEIDSDTGDVCG